MGFNFFKNKKEKVFLGLDIGTEAVKAVSFKKENGKTIILGAGRQYFENYNVFENRDFQSEIIKKAVLGAVQESFAGARSSFKNLPIILGLPPDILKARVIFRRFERKKPDLKISRTENESICRQVLKEAKDSVCREVADEFGIMAGDIEWLSLKITKKIIDGYEIRALKGYGGKELDFKILAVFSLKHYLENIKSILKKSGFLILEIKHLVEKAPFVFQNEKINVIFLDIGGEMTQFFLVKKGLLEDAGEFKSGGKRFSQLLSAKFGINENSARALKEEYSDNLLTISVKNKIREVFLSEENVWKKLFIAGIKRPDFQEGLPFDIYLFGGASLLPEIRECLAGGSKIIFPKDIIGAGNKTIISENPQFTPVLFLIS